MIYIKDNIPIALEAATANQHTETIKTLLQLDPRPRGNVDRMKDITTAANTAISYRNTALLSLFLNTKEIDFSSIYCPCL